MFMTVQRLKFVAIALTAAMIIGAAYLVGAKKAGENAQEVGQRQLQIIALDLESVLDRYETLPFALSFQSEAIHALAAPDNAAAIARLNRILAEVQQQAKVAAIYLMDDKGMTISASNWDNALSFIGHNFSFRPYFKDAINGRPGHFYAIGTMTKEPGYFIAQPVYATSDKTQAPIGVIAVKIRLIDFSRSWSSSEDPITLVDQGGVIFLSNRPSWQYHSIHRLDSASLQKIVDTLQYIDTTIMPVTSLPQAKQAGFGNYVARPAGRLGRILLFPSQARINRIAAVWALAAGLLLAILSMSFLAAYQRKRRLDERVVARQALQQAAKDLDQKIALRTAELTAANHSIENKYGKLKEAEFVLRNTQNELIQAGKLAMLGQMAAGVTHELNQPLTAIRAFSDNATIFLARGQIANVSENLSHISAASARMGVIIGQLKGFSRKSDEAVAVVDLAQSINASALLLESDFKRHGVALEIDVQDPVQLVGNAVRIEQVLINLMRNALDAVELSPERKIQVLLSRETDAAIIRIRDSGEGIPDDVAQHMFEAFFTTKPHGKGLGLGLAISSSIVQAMNGRLTAHNHGDGGAEFTFQLPLPS